MALTPHLGLTLLEPSQAQPEVTVNAALGDLDSAIAGRFSKDMAGLSTYTLTGPESTNWMLNPWDAPAAFSLVVQAAEKGWLVINDANYDCTLITATGAGIVIPPHAQMAAYCDGVNVHTVAPALQSDAPVDRLGAGDVAVTVYTNTGGRLWTDYVTQGSTAGAVTINGVSVGTLPAAALGTFSTPPGGTIALAETPAAWLRVTT